MGSHVMDNTCHSCQQLLTSNIAHPHSTLKLLSSLPNSQMYKCTECHAYLHHFDMSWEVLIEGNTHNKDAAGFNNQVANL